ncbi:MAG: SDR family NAD(P)-dependent oxidoreductase [Cyclobacteriaceae bacterium]|nr:SDR family NAD(P)-dependent oxidoreductase [Cyclobacteriaceae bacterium]MCH8516449.1 SDR family NAD(P)-dependent oxidoreductase [Cyclobacteriaceae bacterium]
MGHIVITGANSGIGKALLNYFASKSHEVTMVCRNPQKAKPVARAVQHKFPRATINLELADLSSMEQVKALTDRLIANNQPIDVLINNAGLIGEGDRQVTSEGFEVSFAVNHLAPFLLTHHLMPLILNSDTKKVINVASEAHRLAPFDKNDLMMQSGYTELKSYGNGKLANILHAKELQNRFGEEGLQAFSYHPGGVASNFAKNSSTFMKVAMFLVRPFFVSTEQGASTGVYLAEKEMHKEDLGQYFDKSKRKSPSKKARDVENQQFLWEESVRLLKPFL